MRIASWMISGLSLAANVVAVILLVQLLRKVDRAWLYKWSRRTGFLVIGLAASWMAVTIWIVAHAIGGVAGTDPSASQKATLLAVGISEGLNCLAAMVVFLLVPTVVAIVVRAKSRADKSPR